MTQSVRGPFTKSFQYEAQSPTGDAMRGTLEAASALDAKQRLSALNLRVLSVTAMEDETSPSTTLAPEAVPPRRGRSRMGPEDFQLFNQQLAHLISAGLPMERGLRLIAADLRSGCLATAATSVADELEKGVPLKEAFAHHASQFPPLYARLVDAGVQTANLPSMLFNLGKHLEMLSRLRRALWRAFAYPLAVIIGLSLVLLFISISIIPQFRDIYKDFHTTLPALTELMLSLGVIYPALLAIVAPLALIALILIAVFRATGRLGTLSDNIGMRIPVLGPVLRANAVARWCDALRLGVQAGLDLPRAMALASDAAGSPRAARDAAALSDALAAGTPPRDTRRTLLPATVPAAFELAAHAGDLSATLATLAGMYERQAEDHLRLLPGVITPILMVLIGVFVGIVVLSLFLPLIKLVQSVSGGW